MAEATAGYLGSRTPRAEEAYWQQIALSRVTVTRADLQRMRDREPTLHAVWDRAEHLLDAAEEAARRPGSRIRLWLFGGAINKAFVNLHAAQVMLARHEAAEHLDAHLQTAMARVADTMPDGPRRAHLEKQYETVRTGDDGAKRLTLERALEWSYNTTDAQYARLRSFRIVLTGVSLAVMVLLAVLALMGLLWPDSLRLCFTGTAGQICPTGAAPSPRDAIVIMVLGAAGGGLAAVLTVSGLQGTSAPYSVPLALSMLKLPVGALTALLGLLLIHGQFVPGLDNLDSSGQILAYAVVLGVAQHAVTAYVDRRGHELLSALPAKRPGGDQTMAGRAPKARRGAKA